MIYWVVNEEIRVLAGEGNFCDIDGRLHDIPSARVKLCMYVCVCVGNCRTLLSIILSVSGQTKYIRGLILWTLASFVFFIFGHSQQPIFIHSG